MPFTIIHKNNNIDFFFNLRKRQKIQISLEKCLRVINSIDKFLKKMVTSDGDLLQSLALLIATRVYISPFENEKILNVIQMVKDAYQY